MDRDLRPFWDPEEVGVKLAPTWETYSFRWLVFLTILGSPLLCSREPTWLLYPVQAGIEFWLSSHLPVYFFNMATGHNTYEILYMWWIQFSCVHSGPENTTYPR